MNTNAAFIMGAVVAATLTSVHGLQASDFSVSQLDNQAIANSPRAREEFPQLARSWLPSTETSGRDEKIVAEIEKSPALASSPRVREIYPQLNGLGNPEPAKLAEDASIRNDFTAVLKNRALANSPKTLEQFPELARHSALFLPTNYEEAGASR